MCEGRYFTISHGLVFAIILSASACGKSPDEISGAHCQFGTGDIIINEIFPASSEDPNLQWLEFFNRSQKDISLHRAKLSINTKVYILLGDLDLTSGDYFVIGNSQQHYVDHVLDNLQINNSSATISLSCMNSVADSIAYGDTVIPAPTKGSSIQLDQAVLDQDLDHHQSDFWCQATSAFDNSNFGSPGKPNLGCGNAFCLDGDNLRRANAPAQGDLLINEVFANPVGVDLGREWLEFIVTGKQNIDLNGLKIKQVNDSDNVRQWQISQQQCLTVESGTYVLVGFNTLDGITPDIPFHANISGDQLYNSASQLQLVSGASVIDAAKMGTPVEGVSLARDPEFLYASLTGDVPFCPERTLTADIIASPGSTNTMCGAVCLENGIWRKPLVLSTGDVFISEVFSNAVGADANKEWIELFVTADHPVDMYRLAITNTNSATLNSKIWILTDELCHQVAPGTYVLISSDPDLMSQAQSIFLNGLSLYNDRANLTLENDLEIIDSAELPKSTQGSSINLDRFHFNNIDNDFVDNFCDGRSPDVFAEKGTPGQENDPCGEDFCKELDQWRSIIKPRIGEISINEVFRQQAVDQNQRRWIELEITASAPIDLNNLELTHSLSEPQDRRWDINPVYCTVAKPGDYKLIAESTSGQDSLLPDIEIPLLDFYTLRGGSLSINIKNDINIDSANLPPVVAGSSTQLNNTSLIPTLSNDDPLSWCLPADAVPALSPLGSPGAMNSACP